MYGKALVSIMKNCDFKGWKPNKLKPKGNLYYGALKLKMRQQFKWETTVLNKLFNFFMYTSKSLSRW